MKKYLSLYILFFTHICLALNPGDQVQDFTLMNQLDQKVKLSDYKGKFIILEWFNSGCPYVQKHYKSQNMQTIQRLYQNNPNVVWLTIVSSAKGKQGYFSDANQALDIMNKWQMASSHLLRDVDGKVGQLYGAKTTPHIFIVGPQQKLRYMGAIDSIASSDPKDIGKARNYITASMSKLLLQQEPRPAKTKPYGCSVKY